MDLTAAIEAFNASNEPRIELLTTRDGRVVATLPRVGREIIVQGSTAGTAATVSAQDVALLCEEARRASAPGLALLDAALGALQEIDAPAHR